MFLVTGEALSLKREKWTESNRKRTNQKMAPIIAYFHALGMFGFSMPEPDISKLLELLIV
jgi:hypothetical protein